jgi:lipopolysaccharide exporter
MAGPNLTSRTLSALSWTYGGAVAGVVPQLVYTTVMARLLDPAAFGLVALAQAFLRFGQYFAHLGIGQALIQKDELDEQEVRAAFTSSVLLGALFSAVAVALAPLAARLFDTPDVTSVVRWLGLTFLLDGLGRTATVLLRRDLRFETLAKIQVPTYVAAFLGVGLGTAAMGAGVWSLVAAALAQSTFLAVAVYAATRHPLRPNLAVRRHADLYSFGGQVSVIGFVQFLNTNLDVFFVGRFLGPSPLGQYNRATYLVVVPFTELVTNLSKVLFPAFSRVQSDLARLRAAYVVTTDLVAALLLPAAAGMVVAAPEIVRVVLGPGWGPAALVLPVLALVSGLAFVAHIGGIVLESIAVLRPKLVLEVAVLLVGVAAFATVVATEGGLVAFATAAVTSAAVHHVATVLLVAHALQVPGRTTAAMYLRTAGAATAVVAAIGAVTLALRSAAAPVLAVLLAQVTAGGLAMALCFTHGPLVQVRRDVRDRLASAGQLDGRVGSVLGRVLSAGR